MTRLRVLVTRALDDVEPWSDALEEAGFEPVALPLLTFQRSASADEVCQALAGLGEGWVVVTSARAVPALKDALPIPGWVKVAAVGPVTAHRLREAGIGVALVGDGEGASGLAGAFARLDEGATEKKVLWLAGNLASDELRVSLKNLGFEVSVLEVYRTTTAPVAPETAAAALAGIDAAIFASPSAVKAFVAVAGTEWLERNRDAVTVIAIGPTTERALRNAGFRRTKFAADASAEGVLRVVRSALEGGK